MSSMLTTVDNPYNPYIQFDEWFAFDELKGYHTCSYLGRVAKTTRNVSDATNELIIEKAIDEIIELNPLGIYIRAPKPE